MYIYIKKKLPLFVNILITCTHSVFYVIINPKRSVIYGQIKYLYGTVVFYLLLFLLLS